MFVYPACVRYPGEGETAFEAFQDFVSLGWDTHSPNNPRRKPRGNLDSLRRKYQPNTVDLWAEQFEWEDRANTYDTAMNQAIAGLIRDSVARSQSALASFTGMASDALALEFERSLTSLRGKKQTIAPEQLVAMAERLTKTLAALSPPKPEDSKTYSPNLGGLPEDELIALDLQAYDAAKSKLQPGEPPLPGVTEPLDLSGDSAGLL